MPQVAIADGEIYLDGDAEDKIEAFKTRHMGLLAPDEIWSTIDDHSRQDSPVHRGGRRRGGP